MGLFGQITEQRRKHILSFVRSHLEDDEAVVQWARAREPHSQREGFVYVTQRRCLIHWRGGDRPKAIAWDEVAAWGVDKDAQRGPILFVDTGDDRVFIQMQTGSKALALGAGTFMRRFGSMAPASTGPVGDGRLARFEPVGEVEVAKEKLSPRELTKRIAVTVLGVLLVVGGMVFGVVPGPGGFVLVIAGLAVLASQYDWAQDALDWAKLKYKQTAQKIKARRRSPG